MGIFDASSDDNNTLMSYNNAQCCSSVQIRILIACQSSFLMMIVSNKSKKCPESVTLKSASEHITHNQISYRFHQNIELHLFYQAAGRSSACAAVYSANACMDINEGLHTFLCSSCFWTGVIAITLFHYFKLIPAHLMPLDI